jgi:hypothetical protein
MKCIAEILPDLLQSNECVVIPSFGGFIIKEKSARIDFELGLALPPFKEIAFNIQLKDNDGVLANRFSLVNQIAYSESVRAIEEEVNEWNNTITLRKTLKISKIGQFWKDVEGNLQFEQDRSFNLLMSAYGLEVVYFVPASTEEAIPAPQENNRPHKSNVWKYAAAAAIAIPIAFYSIWIPVKTPAIQSGMISYQDFNPFKTQLASSYLEATVNIPNIKEVSIESTYTDAYDASRNPVLFNQDQTTYRVEAHTMYCIAGCFSSEQNANRLSQKLDLLGFDCTILHEGGLYKVSLGQGISEQAINNINLKAKSLNIDTWILK